MGLLTQQQVGSKAVAVVGELVVVVVGVVKAPKYLVEEVVAIVKSLSLAKATTKLKIGTRKVAEKP